MMKKNDKRKFLGPFNKKMVVKMKIANSFLHDSDAWLRIYEELHKHYRGVSFEAKKFVILKFSVECSLKSLIVSFSKKNELPEAVYKKIRRYGHNIVRLYEECNMRSNHRYKLFSKSFASSISLINRFGVEIRYDLDFTKWFRNQKWHRGIGDVSSIVIENEFRKRFLNEAKKLNKLATARDVARFSKHCAQIASNHFIADTIVEKLLEK